MAISLLAALVAALGADEETYTVTLAFETMHCDECRAELEGTLKKIPGFKSALVSGDSVTVTFEGKTPVPAFRRLAQDLKLVSVSISIHGTVSASGEKLTLVARRSGTALALLNPEKPKAEDRLAGLRKQMGGKNRFRIEGTLVDGKAVILGAFAPADWKD